LVMLADTAMYAAKHLGRNQTRAAREPSVLALNKTVEVPQRLEERKVLGIIEALITLQEGRDRPTSQHERRVAALARRLALDMGLSEEAAYIVSLGGLLHDLGKVALPDKLLLKCGSLTEEEFSTVRTHPVTGSEVLSSVPDLYVVASIVRSHHEWMNGSGYPDKLVGEAIPLGARIVAVVDAYDVITHSRPYQPAHSSTEALHALQKNSGPQFDPRVVDALIRLLASSSSLPQQAEAFR
jgi:HD-GYP domain-containing protein (c-di-GMP phosphodiesterase class II)